MSEREKEFKKIEKLVWIYLTKSKCFLVNARAACDSVEGKFTLSLRCAAFCIEIYAEMSITSALFYYCRAQEELSQALMHSSGRNSICYKH